MRIARVSLGAAARGMTQQDDVPSTASGQPRVGTVVRPAACTCARPSTPTEPSSSR